MFPSVSLLYAILLSISLCLDDLTVSVISGLLLKKPRIRDMIRIGLSFAVPEALMFLFGWIGGYLLAVSW